MRCLVCFLLGQTKISNAYFYKNCNKNHGGWRLEVDGDGAEVKESEL